MTVRDLINAYSGNIIYVTDEANNKLYYGTGFLCDLRLKLCTVSKFNIIMIDGYFALHITIKGVQIDD